MTNIPPPAEELRILDLELHRLDARRAQLLHRRAWLLSALRAAAPPPQAPPHPRHVPEATPPNVQNALLTLGGILLTVAAIAFTLVSWGHLGIGGRSAVLALLTLTALGVPALLLHRSLRSTAETVAALGLALTVLDAYALHAVALPDTDPAGYAAAASAVLAALWAAYGRVFGELRLPLPVAVVTAQLPLFLWASDSGTHAIGAALLVTAAFDTALALRATDTAVRVVATVGACATGLWGTMGAGWLSWSATDVPEAARAAALLALATSIALATAWLTSHASPATATGTAFAGALTAVAAVGGVVREALPGGWSVPAHLACAIALLATVRITLPHPLRKGIAGAALLVHGLAVLWTLPTVAAALLGPTHWAADPWSSTTPPHTAYGFSSLSDLPVSEPAMASLVLGVVAVVAYLAGGMGAAWAAETTVVGATGIEGAGAGGAAGSTAVVGPDGAAGTAPAADTGRAAQVPSTAGSDRPAGPAGATGTTGATGTAPAAETGQAGRTPGPAGSSQAAGPSGDPAIGGTPGADATGGFGAAAVRTSPAAAFLAAARPVALALAWAAVFTLPFAFELPYAAGLFVHCVLTAALLGLAVRSDAAALARTSLGLGLASSGSVAFLSLATTSATLGTLGALTGLFLAAAVLASRRSASGVAAIAAGAGIAYATALVCATGAALELRVDHTGLLVLVVPALAAGAAARLGRRPLTPIVEITGAAAGGLGIVLTAGHAPTLATALALGGVIAAGTAVRADRRRVGYAAGALFLLATWVRLASWDVTMPEAYTLPATVPALVVGFLRRRRDPAASSWTAYGPGLAATLLPSLAAAWGDAHWQRPLLLGTAALLVTLTGARHRLQAPLVIGGTVLALDALHELAPYIVQVVDTLPRWLPPALAGMLLLAIGATYEQRLRDARKVRDVLGRMH
ncbi:SCO7613 C-terminal domain-containing membrane protein [Streptomyces sp. NPDC059037]|uniref:SCO7613 C-terminal domain-containing membrane protein n=1 Tax=Streptomyces sp. NPDC059037 TaxID=3346710 RepID=UPI00369A06E2